MNIFPLILLLVNKYFLCLAQLFQGIVELVAATKLKHKLSR